MFEKVPIYHVMLSEAKNPEVFKKIPSHAQNNLIKVPITPAILTNSPEL
jgi:hypothetical protein